MDQLQLLRCTFHGIVCDLKHFQPSREDGFADSILSTTQLGTPMLGCTPFDLPSGQNALQPVMGKLLKLLYTIWGLCIRTLRCASVKLQPRHYGLLTDDCTNCRRYQRPQFNSPCCFFNSLRYREQFACLLA